MRCATAGTVLARQQQDRSGDRGEVARLGLPAPRRIEVHQHLVDAARGSRLRFRGKRGKAALAAPEVDERRGGCLPAARGNEVADDFRAPVHLGQRRIIGLEHAESHRLVQRQARDALAVAGREPQRNEGAERMPDQMHARMRTGELVDVIEDESDFVIRR
jgi:hypothetical protein